MRNSLQRCVFLALTLFVGTAMAANLSSHYTLKTIDIPLPGAYATSVLGINPQGDFVGRYMIGKAVHGYLLNNAGLTLIDDPNILLSAPVTYASGINPEGFVTGYYLDPPPDTDLSTLVQDQMGMDFDMSGDPPPSTRLRSFMRSPLGDFTPIDFPASQVPFSYPADGYVQTMAIRITPTGIVVGCFHHFGNDFDHTMHGFVYYNGQYSFFPVNGTMHNGLTPDGRIIVGVWYSDLTHYHSYVIVDGVYKTFDPPGAVVSQAYDINPRGEIVGDYTDSSGKTHGYFLGPQGFITVDFPHATMTRLRTINPRGDLGGFYFDTNGALHGFIAIKNGSE